MQTLDFKIGFGRKKLVDGEEPRTMRHHTWVAVAIGGSAIVGAGVGLYGANKQSQNVSDTNAANAQLQTQQNNSAWQAYLLSRGVNPQGATAGNMPATMQATNTRLPLWATWTMPGTPAVAGTPGTRRLVRRTPAGGAPATAPKVGGGGEVQLPPSDMPVAPGGGGGNWWGGGGGGNQVYQLQ